MLFTFVVVQKVEVCFVVEGLQFIANDLVVFLFILHFAFGTKMILQTK